VIQLDKKPAIIVREPDATRQPTPQDIQLMSKHRVLNFKPQLRPEWQGQDGQHETEQPDHSASSSDSITSSTQVRFSVHTGVGTVAIIYPTQGGAGVHTRPADLSVGLQWAQPALTDADPAKFEAWLATQLAPLEAAGVHLTALELGNEINGPYFNGDFLPAQASGRVLGLSDLDNPNDPEGPSGPGDFHPESLTDSGLDTLASSGSCHRVKAAAFH
jgi:hypothetical protein